VNQPTPAIVAQSAVRRLPRWALLLLCLAYVIPGFVMRGPWRSNDMEAFGYMRELALGKTDWLAPKLSGLAPSMDGLLPYWLGALSCRASSGCSAPRWRRACPSSPC
jgi:4-amino-4-deoxy-L-arabinose transferase-like glycosyltransferase